MRALVTGCAGFIGSHLTESLLEDAHDVVGVDCFNENYGRREKLRNLDRAREWQGFDFVPLDLARGDLRDLVDDCEVVFHIAAEPGVRPSWGQRFEWYVRNNVLATQHLLEAMRAGENKRFVYASSSSIYGQAESFPTAEETTPRPFSPYGVTKLAAEQLCELYHANFGLDTVSLRYFSVYGPRQRPDMAFAIFCRAALDGKPLEIFGDGHQTRDFTFVRDVVAATRAAASAPGVGGEALNVGGGSSVSLEQAVQVLQEVAGRTLVVQRISRQHGDVRDTAADITKARALLHYAPTTPFDEGLAAEWDWLATERARSSA